MNDFQAALLFFAFLTPFHLAGGMAIGAGGRARRLLPLLWGLLVGAGPLYFGVERGVRLGEWGALALQVIVLAGSAVATGLWLPGVRAWFGRPAVDALEIGTFIMAGGALLGAFFVQRGSETLSLILGGAGFIFGAMWFGSGLQRLRDK